MNGTEAGSAEALATELGDALRERGLVVTTAESCTGGLIAGAITSVAGSSAWFREGYVTYANPAKVGLLGVPQATLDAHGAVSRETVEAMALGALGRAGADVAIAVSGIAGPGGEVPGKPVGTVWLAVAVAAPASGQGGGQGSGQGAAGAAPAKASGPAVGATLHTFPGDRREVRAAAVIEGLRATLSRLANGVP